MSVLAPAYSMLPQPLVATGLNRAQLGWQTDDSKQGHIEKPVRQDSGQGDQRVRMLPYPVSSAGPEGSERVMDRSRLSPRRNFGLRHARSLD